MDASNSPTPLAGPPSLEPAAARASPGGERYVWRWKFADGRAESLAPLVAGWDALAGMHGAETLKSNLRRQVIALPAAAEVPALIAKNYWVRGAWEKLKYLLLPSRARAEWEGLRALDSAGVRVPRVLGYGEVRRGGVLLQAALLMERIPGALALPKWLEGHTDPAARTRVLEDLGKEVAILHDASLSHSDIHAGNVLVRPRAAAPGEAGGEVYLIDHHVVKKRRFLPEWRRARDLAKLFHSLRFLVARPALARFLRGYDAGRLTPAWRAESDESLLRRFDLMAARLESVRLKSRSKRCWVNGGEFAREWEGNVLIYRHRSVERADALALLKDDPPPARVLKERVGYRVSSSVLPVHGETRLVVLKVHTRRAPAKRLLHRIVRGPLERAWGASRALDVRGIPNPKGFALLVEHLEWMPRRTTLVTAFIPDAKPLRDLLIDTYWPYPRGDRRLLCRNIERLAELVRRLHDTGIYHRDLNPMNILAGAGSDGLYRYSFIDLDSVRTNACLTERRKLKNLAQIGLIPEGHITTREKLRFLRAYDRGEGRYWNRECIARLQEMLGAETMHIITRMSLAEERAAEPTLTGDPRFRLEDVVRSVASKAAPPKGRA